MFSAIGFDNMRTLLTQAMPDVCFTNPGCPCYELINDDEHLQILIKFIRTVVFPAPADPITLICINVSDCVVIAYLTTLKNRHTSHTAI